jgi:hypothetical protein
MPTDHSEAALDILNQTNDGNDLSLPDLQLLMLAVNGGLSPAGDAAYHHRHKGLRLLEGHRG